MLIVGTSHGSTSLRPNALLFTIIITLFLLKTIGVRNDSR